MKVKNPKVLVVTNMYPSDGDVSWRGSFVKEQVDSCKKIGPVEIDVFHIKGKVCGGNNINYVLAHFKIAYLMLKNKYDIIHCHHAFCVIVAIFFFRRIIYTVHEGELNNHFTSHLIKAAILISKYSIFVSRLEFERSKKKNKIFLPCGIDFDYFELKEQEYINQVLFPADPKRTEKNSWIIESIENRLKAEFGITVFYGGKIPRNQMPERMRESLCVLSCGKFESDGLVVKEAMALNVPIISTNVGNSKYYVDETCGVIIDPTSESLYSAIKNVFYNRDLYTNGRSKLDSLNISSNAVAMELLSIYERFLSR
ncbi:glycosyltransferase family 4 protein [Vibrio cholerae]|uniref:glycosyltransferase n=1 Tax=Vibrio cholerae TaxID=666 RepID=UPI0035A9DD20